MKGMRKRKSSPKVARDLAGQWALITGASSGFGVDFAHLLAARGANLVLVARSAAPMRALAADLHPAHDIECVVIPMDLTRTGATGSLQAKLDSRGIAVNLLVNNAGFGVAGDFVDTPIERSLGMIELNISALTELTHNFAHDMVERGGGQILLVGSLGAFHPLPTMAVYAATKAYVLSFGEALHEELKVKGVTVTVLCPGPTATNFFAVAGNADAHIPSALMMASRPVAQIGLDALAAGRASVVPGLTNIVGAQAARLVPRGLFPRLAYKLLNR